MRILPHLKNPFIATRVTLSPYRKFLFITGCLLLGFGAGMALLVKQGKTRPVSSTSKMENSVYIWQEDWSPLLNQAVGLAAPHVDAFMVYAGEIRANEGRIERRTKRVNWTTLAKANQPTIIVIRMEDRVFALAKSGRIPEIADAMAREAGDIQRAARDAEVRLAGLQLDFDCPTAGLDIYRKILRRVRKDFPQVSLSITALPDWMGSRDFKSLVRETDYFVLQVHSLSTPKTIQDSFRLCNTSRLEGWLQAASAAGTPYYVALPTYGYLLFYDGQGKYAGFAAEGQYSRRRDLQTKLAMADPDEMAEAAKSLQEKPPRHCRGIAWFRLPVETDRLNWPWPTLQAVMEGRGPTMVIRAELRNPKPDLFEVWVKNNGEAKSVKPIRVGVDLQGLRLIARDGIGGYRWDRGSSNLTGPAPPPGAKRMAAWFRLMPGHGNEAILKQSIPVEVIP